MNNQETLISTTKSFSFSELGLLSKLARALADKDEDLQPFVKEFFSWDKVEKQIISKLDNYSERENLCRALEKQHAEINIPAKTRENLSKLSSQNTFTFTAGHQLTLLAGPSYFVYKLLQVVKMADEANVKFQVYNFVPVFWLATEDHDFEEIRKTRIFGKDLELEAVENNYKITGDFSAKLLKPIVEELQTILGENENAKALSKQIEDCLKISKSLTDFTRNLIYKLFPETGIVVLDGDDSLLKKSFIPVIKKELETQFSFEKVNEQCEAVEALNHKIQVRPRPINLFYLEEGNRRRILPYENGYFTLLGSDKIFSKEEILIELENYPERFSPNVILRPLYQEVILPNLAYIGGGGEIAYWLELSSMFEEAKITFPFVIVRNSLIISNIKQEQKLEKLGFTTADVFQPLKQLQAIYLENKGVGDEIDLTVAKDSLQALEVSLLQEVSAIDKSLEATVFGNTKAQQKFIDNLEKKLLNRLKAKNETELNQLASIHNKIYPEGVLQERYENVLQYLVNSGFGLFSKIYEAISVEESKLHIVYL